MFSQDEVQELIERRAKLCFYHAQRDVFEIDSPLPDGVDIWSMDSVLASRTASDIREFVLLSSAVDTLIHNYVPDDYLLISRERVLVALGENPNVTLPEGSEIGDDTPLISSPLRTRGAFSDSHASTSCFTFFARCFTSCFSSGRDKRYESHQHLIHH